MSEHMGLEPGSKPNPDPTVATNDAVERAVKAERDYVDGQIKVLMERLSATTDLTAERFAAVGERFMLIEERRKEQKADTETAVAAAFSAAKEGTALQTSASEAAIAKSEAATTKSIDGLAATFRTADEAQRRDVDDLKDRVGRIESVKQGASEQRTETREGVTFAQGLIATAIVLALFVLNVIGIAYSRQDPPVPAIVTVTEPATEP